MMTAARAVAPEAATTMTMTVVPAAGVMAAGSAIRKDTPRQRAKDGKAEALPAAVFPRAAGTQTMTTTAAAHAAGVTVAGSGIPKAMPKPPAKGGKTAVRPAALA